MIAPTACGLIQICDTGFMTDDPVVDAVRAYRRAATALERRRAELADAIGAAIVGGRRQHEIVELTGYTREHVRRIVRDYESRADSVS